MKPLRALFWLWLLIFWALLRFAHARVPALLIFGDSVVDAGTGRYLNSSASSSPESPNNPPYGVSYFGYPTGRYSDGRTIADFLAQNLELPLTPPFLRPGVAFDHGANFASAGSRLLRPASGKLDYVSIETQLDQFDDLVSQRTIEHGEDDARSWVSSSVFLISIGSNDVRDFFTNTSQYTGQQFVTMLMDSYKPLIFRLYTGGARKIVLLGLGPLGCTPFARIVALERTRRPGCLEPANELALGFNTALRQLVYSFNRDFTGLQVLLAKPYELSLGLIAAPIRFGFVQADVACCTCCGSAQCAYPACGDPARYVFWDAGHYSEAADLFMFNSFWIGGLAAIEPYNLLRLFRS